MIFYFDVDNYVNNHVNNPVTNLLKKCGHNIKNKGFISINVKTVGILRFSSRFIPILLQA